MEGRKKQAEKYDIGLSITVHGVGWCVTDPDGKMLRKGRNHLYGMVKFDEAESGKERRASRAARRKLARKKIRLQELQNLLSTDIARKDESFFYRLKETALKPDERIIHGLYSSLPKALFEDGSEVVLRKNKSLPIYQIRSSLINTDKKADIRYVYLALAHILKSRGQFENTTSEDRNDIEGYLRSVLAYLNAEYDLTLNVSLHAVREYIGLLEKGLNFSELEDIAMDLFAAGSSGRAELRTVNALLTGNEADIQKLFHNLQDKKIVSFENNTENTYTELQEDEADIMLTLSDIYAWRKVATGREMDVSISEMMNERYEQHKEDLANLKSWYRTYTDKDTYDRMFHDDQEKDNYNAYTRSRTNPAEYSEISWNGCSQAEFYARIKKNIMENADGFRDGQKNILAKMYDSHGRVIPNGFMPLQRISLNRSVTNRQQLRDMIGILDQQEKYHESLRQNRSKIISLCTYRVPAYVGPLTQDKRSPFNPWIQYTGEHKPGEHIKPWNLAEKIDLELTAERFIDNLIGKCTYIPSESALPKHSLLYEECMLLDELNRVKVQFDGVNAVTGSPCRVEEYIQPVIKKQLMNELFAKYRHVSADFVIKWLAQNTQYGEKENLRLISANGSDKKRFQSTLTARNDMERIFERRITPEDPYAEDLEKIIKWSTAYSDRGLYRERIRKNYTGVFTEDQISQLSALRYSGWGMYSRKLLTEKLCTFRDDHVSVLTVLRETNDNFMRIYHNKKYRTKIRIDRLTPKKDEPEISYNAVKELIRSPGQRRAAWQAVRIVEELKQYMGKDPNAIYLRNVRDTNNKRKVEKKKELTRYEHITNLYNAYEQDTGKKLRPSLKAELQRYRNGMDDIQYLYFTQLGRCMYSGEEIDLKNAASYHISYIVPLCLLRDTSQDNQILVLNDADYRSGKDAMPKSIVEAMDNYWGLLAFHGFITGNKKHKLQITEYDDFMLQVYLESQFIDASIIVSRLKKLFTDHYHATHIYGINARLTDQLRLHDSLYRIADLNDMQEAYDAFLTAHIGSFADRYLGKATNEESYSRIVMHMWQRANGGDKNGLIIGYYRHDQDGEGQSGSAWSGAEERWEYLKKVYGWHDGFVTYMPKKNTGKFYRETIYRPGEGLCAGVKEHLSADDYGGHSTAYTSHMAVIAYERRGKTIKELVNVPVYVALRSRRERSYTHEYLKTRYSDGYSNLRILADNIGLNQEVVFEGHPLYMKSALVAVNARQLYVSTRYMEIIRQALSLPEEEVVALYQKDMAKEPGIEETLNYLLNKYLDQYRLYPKLTKGLENKETLLEAAPEDQVRIIRVLINCMNTRGNHIANILKEIRSRDPEGKPLLGGDTRIENKRIYGSEIVLIDHSVTGIYSTRRVI